MFISDDQTKLQKMEELKKSEENDPYSSSSTTIPN